MKPGYLGEERIIQPVGVGLFYNFHFSSRDAKKVQPEETEAAHRHNDGQAAVPGTAPEVPRSWVKANTSTGKISTSRWSTVAID